ncbi:TetR/AcrR family transcriptional regulator [Gracilibacillus sp. S3-1-1]|uniref:TetR/AcrR family transcriptional regulator n=1 Tax=Gracilibacillus pellucidus TaxID=3095368 RepID=A0ACC6M9S8_9BACI|nr:TetR/AcrR family transcriptional regulator [Gracilibacillus sp. S3-1-1]MDX8047700.1 TetR/AcrR family transcriptional regulator [Gracilibacillus sp. S3-1-1]
MNDRKRKVADIALKLFVEKGFQQTSIQEIIDKATISKGTFYNYFSSKNDCIADILEDIRYDASQQRVSMQIGKDPQDREVLIEQITILMKLNEEKNLRILFENILTADQPELKKLVIHHRLVEAEWLANRLIDVFGEDIREYATEAVILFFGMLQYMLFTLDLTNSHYSLHDLIDTMLSHTELLISQMKQTDHTILSDFAVDFLQTNFNSSVITLPEIIELAEQIQEHYDFNEEQQDLFDVIMDELDQERIRKIVVKKLLKPFLQLFDGTAAFAEVQHFTNAVWSYLKTI